MSTTPQLKEVFFVKKKRKKSIEKSIDFSTFLITPEYADGIMQKQTVLSLLYEHAHIFILFLLLNIFLCFINCRARCASVMWFSLREDEPLLFSFIPHKECRKLSTFLFDSHILDNHSSLVNKSYIFSDYLYCSEY